MRLFLILFTLLAACFAPVTFNSSSHSISFEKLPVKSRSDVTKPSPVITPVIPVITPGIPTHEMAWYPWKSRGGNVDVKNETKHKIVQPKLRMTRKRRAMTSRVKIFENKEHQGFFCDSSKIVPRALTCVAGSIIKVINGSFGRWPGVQAQISCPGGFSGSCYYNVDIWEFVAKGCNDKQTCDLRFSHQDRDAGDFCEGATKVSEVFWECVPKTQSWYLGPNGKSYINLYKENKDKEASKQLCEDAGGFLPEPRNPEENNFLKEFAKTYTFYLGLNDWRSEGVWAWDTSATKVNWFDWNPKDNEPNGGNKENCVLLVKREGWADYECTNTEDARTVVCERYQSAVADDGDKDKSSDTTPVWIYVVAMVLGVAIPVILYLAYKYYMKEEESSKRGWRKTISRIFSGSSNKSDRTSRASDCRSMTSGGRSSTSQRQSSSKRTSRSTRN